VLSGTWDSKFNVKFCRTNLAPSNSVILMTPRYLFRKKQLVFLEIQQHRPLHYSTSSFVPKWRSFYFVESYYHQDYGKYETSNSFKMIDDKQKRYFGGFGISLKASKIPLKLHQLMCSIKGNCKWCSSVQ